MTLRGKKARTLSHTYVDHRHPGIAFRRSFSCHTMQLPMPVPEVCTNCFRGSFDNEKTLLSTIHANLLHNPRQIHATSRMSAAKKRCTNSRTNIYRLQNISTCSRQIPTPSNESFKHFLQSVHDVWVLTRLSCCSVHPVQCPTLHRLCLSLSKMIKRARSKISDFAPQQGGYLPSISSQNASATSTKQPPQTNPPPAEQTI